MICGKLPEIQATIFCRYVPGIKSEKYKSSSICLYGDCGLEVKHIVADSVYKNFPSEKNPVTEYIQQELIREALLHKIHEGMSHYIEANISWDLELFNRLKPDNQLRLQIAIETLAKGHLYAVVMGVSQEKFIVSWSYISDTPMSVADAALGVKYDVRRNAPEVRKRRV